MKRLLFFLVSILGASALLVSLAAAAAPSAGGTRLHHWKVMPVGFTLADLQHYELTPGSIRSIDAKMATARDWGANTIRLQVVQDRLVGRYGHRYDAAYMADVEALVSYGRELGLVMVINDQTEPARHFKANEGMPTRATYAFWSIMMGVYADVPGVTFDLFNEPRHCSWQTWRVTFQALVTYIRHHARNTIWLEGKRFASSLQGQPRIYGKNVMLTYHHPGAPWPREVPNNAWTWDGAFGRRAFTATPVIDGEFTNNHSTFYLPPKVMRAYFRYARQHNIGMLFFGMDRKLLTRYREA